MKIKPITKKFHANFTTSVSAAGVVESGPDMDTWTDTKQPEPKPTQKQPINFEPPADITEAEEREILWEYETFIRFEPSDNPDDRPPELSAQAQKYIKLLERERVSGYEHPEIWGRFAEIV